MKITKSKLMEIIKEEIESAMLIMSEEELFQEKKRYLEDKIRESSGTLRLPLTDYEIEWAHNILKSDEDEDTSFEDIIGLIKKKRAGTKKKRWAGTPLKQKLKYHLAKLGHVSGQKPAKKDYAPALKKGEKAK